MRAWLVLLLLAGVSAQALVRDPTQPPGYQSVATEQFSLPVSAIIYNKLRPRTVIGGHTYYIGDKIKGVEVMDIRRDAVYLKGVDGEFVLSLPYPSIKTPAIEQGAHDKT